jgi:hypothetical protein
MRDGARPGGRAVPIDRRRTRDVAEKNQVAIYRGEQYVAETVDGNLIINEMIYSDTKGVQKTWVANYVARDGYRYTAENSGDALIVYAIADGDVEGALQPGGTIESIIRHTSEQIPAGSARDNRTSDRKVKDHLRTIRDTQNKMSAINRSASDFWKPHAQR